MKKILFALILFVATSCEKTELVEYKIYSITPMTGTNGGCKFTAATKSPGKPVITFVQNCGDYTIGDVIFRVEE